MRIDAIAYSEVQITCPTNASNPKWGDPCHTLSRDAGRSIVIIRYDEQRQENSEDFDNGE